MLVPFLMFVPILKIINPFLTSLVSEFFVVMIQTLQCFMLRTIMFLRIDAKSSKCDLQGRKHISKPNYCFETDFIIIDYARSLVFVLDVYLNLKIF